MFYLVSKSGEGCHNSRAHVSIEGVVRGRPQLDILLLEQILDLEDRGAHLGARGFSFV